jgi:hypothetical protein
VRPHGIFAFSPTNIWFADADVFWWNGQSQLLQVHQVVNTVLSAGQYVDKLWGSSPSDIYAVGINGAIAHYDGLRWRRVESGTGVDIRDVWGGISSNGSVEIIAVASYGVQVPQAKALIRIEAGSARLILDEGLPMDLTSVWFVPGRKYLVGGAGLYYSLRLGDRWRQDSSDVLHHVSRISATGWNDMVVSGSFGYLSHFNGWSWKRYSDEGFPTIDGVIGARVEQRLLLAVGWLVNGKAVAVRGQRH